MKLSIIEAYEEQTAIDEMAQDSVEFFLPKGWTELHTYKGRLSEFSHYRLEARQTFSRVHNPRNINGVIISLGDLF